MNAQADNKSSSDWLVRSLPALIVLLGVLTVVWVVVRNEPFTDQSFAFAIRVFLSVAAGFAVRELPGFLNLEMGADSQRITATGALGFAVLTFFSAPYVAPNLAPESPPARIECRVWKPREYLGGATDAELLGPNSSRIHWLGMVARILQENQDHEAEKQLRNPDAKKRFYTYFVIAESDPFDSPYRSFEAVVRSVPAAGYNRDSSHDVYPFLVKGSDDMKSLTPLVSLDSAELRGPLIEIPASKQGDYILLLVRLRTQIPPEMMAKSTSIPMSLTVL